MIRESNKHPYLVASTLLIVTSLLLEIYSKFVVFSEANQLSGNQPQQFAAQQREAEVWIYLAVGCAIVGSLLASFAPAQRGKSDQSKWWIRFSRLMALTLWALLALLYLTALSYPIVGAGYVVSFVVLLISGLPKSPPA